MQLEDAIATRRSIRRFAPRPVAVADLRAIANAGRLAATAGNRQPCRFIAVTRSDLVARMHQHVEWLAGAGDPPPGTQPAAYAVILADVAVNASFGSDCAAAAQNMLLVAHGRGIGGCWIGSVNRPAVRRLLAVPMGLEIYAVLALGYPAETAMAIESAGEVAVERSEDGIVRVPKRALDDVLRFEVWEQ
jgi:nitroreductase